jgi:hypothetical protein
MAVTIIENFISAEEAREYVDFLDPLSNGTERGIWNALGYPDSLTASTVSEDTGVVFGNSDPTNKNLGALYQRIKTEAERVWGVEMDLCQSNYQMMPVGTKNPLHADAINLDGTPIQPDGEPEELEWSGLLYLNSHGVDFTGGEVEFPEFDLWYRPKVGDLVIFKGDIEHRHGVHEVIAGERRNIVFFWAKRGNVSRGRGYFEY